MVLEKDIQETIKNQFARFLHDYENQLHVDKINEVKNFLLYLSLEDVEDLMEFVEECKTNFHAVLQWHKDFEKSKYVKLYNPPIEWTDEANGSFCFEEYDGQFEIRLNIHSPGNVICDVVDFNPDMEEKYIVNSASLNEVSELLIKHQQQVGISIDDEVVLNIDMTTPFVPCTETGVLILPNDEPSKNKIIEPYEIFEDPESNLKDNVEILKIHESNLHSNLKTILLRSKKYLYTCTEDEIDWINPKSFSFLVIDEDRFSITHSHTQKTTVINIKQDTDEDVEGHIDGLINFVMSVDEIESAPPLTAKTVMGSAPDKIEPSSEMEM